jgi:Spy/CpxP family protein refolding chaperone
MLLNKKKSPALLLSLTALFCLAFGTSLRAQNWQGDDRGGGGSGAPPMARSFRGMAHGRWWNNPTLAQQVGLTDDQKKKMDDIFQQHRLKLIDLDAAVQKQEAIMQPLIEADQPDETKILAQIDAIAQARAELEKDRARMLFSIRQTLTPDQWKKLRALVRQGPPRDGREGREGRGWGRGNGGPDGGAGPKGQQPPPPPSGAPGDGAE